MNLIIGGYAQGKKAYAAKQYDLKAEEILSDRLPDRADVSGSLKRICLDHFNDRARECYLQGRDLLAEMKELDRQLSGRLILLSTEIGNGIVPIDREDRLFREWMGRLQVQLAAEAAEVVRICCGLPQILKKAKPLQVELSLIRHGATPGNSEHRYIGRTDEALSEEGSRMVLKKKASLKMQSPLVFASPMKRCRETAKLLWPEREPILIDSWQEMDFGSFEGKNYWELKDDPDYQAWIDSNGSLPFPGGESREGFICRSMEGLRQVLQIAAGRAEGSRIVSGSSCPCLAAAVHGGTIMAILSSLAGGDYFDYQLQNAEGYRLQLSWDPMTSQPTILEYERW